MALIRRTWFGRETHLLPLWVFDAFPKPGHFEVSRRTSEEPLRSLGVVGVQKHRQRAENIEPHLCALMFFVLEGFGRSERCKKSSLESTVDIIF